MANTLSLSVALLLLSSLAFPQGENDDSLRPEPAPVLGQTRDSLPQTPVRGWHARICPEFTQADTLLLRIGPWKGDSLRLWNRWRKGDPVEFVVPPDLAAKERVRVLAEPLPGGRKASFCILFDGHVVRSLRVKKKKTFTMASDETSRCGC